MIMSQTRRGGPVKDRPPITTDTVTHGCRAYGGCRPDDRCREHQGDPQRAGELFATVLDAITARAGRRLRLIRGGKW